MRHCMTCGGALPLPSDRCRHCGRVLTAAEQAQLKLDDRRWWIVTGGLAVSSVFLALTMWAGSK